MKDMVKKMEDIKVIVRKEIKTTEVETVYSILTCRCCSKQEEFKGKPDMSCLPGGWASLTLNTQSNGSVYEWLLCPYCVTTVKFAAGLDK